MGRCVEIHHIKSHPEKRRGEWKRTLGIFPSGSGGTNSQAHLLADGTISPPPPPFQSPLEWVADPLTNTPILTLKVEGETIRYQLEDPPPHLQHPNPKGELHSICGEQGQGQEIMDSSLLLGHKEDLEAKFQQSPPHGLGSSQSQLIEVEAQEQTGGAI